MWARAVPGDPRSGVGAAVRGCPGAAGRSAVPQHAAVARSTAEQPEARQAPRSPRGQKDSLPGGSARQTERLRRCCEEQWRLLCEERPERP